MRCPKCNAEIPSGRLYCPECGEEIKIVPEYEPELETSMQEILTNVAETMVTEPDSSQSFQEDLQDFLNENQAFSTDSEERRKQELQERREKRRLHFLLGGGVIFAVLILLLAGVGIFLKVHYFSYDYQMKKAENCFAQKDYSKATQYFSRAMELDQKSGMVKYRLGETYLELSDQESALLLFKEVAASGETLELRTAACQKVVDYYVAKEEYEEISDFLMDLGEDEVTASFNKYMAPAPEFSYVEGSYETIVPLKLTSNTAGTIYYTMDGTTPDRTSQIYTSPIFLENGDYIITAFFVNDFNVESDVVVKSYHIDVSVPVAPEVSAYSGDYEEPTLIYAEAPDGEKVYYTIDGTEPDSSAREYTEPIHMPLGKSRYKFVTCNEEGIASEVVTREYNLVLKNAISVTDAESILTQGMLEAGKIYDLSGLSYEIWGKYLYRYQYVSREDAVGDVFVLAEICEDTEGIQTRTGALYAVGAYDGVRYRVSLDENGRYIFQEF